MKTRFKSFAISILLCPMLIGFVSMAEGADYQPELFEKVKLVYEDSFDGELNTDFWEVRQHSTWEIAAGVLTGSQSSKEFQEKMIAKGDRAHAGFKPVIWLKQVPENFVCSMRMRYDAKDYHPRFPLLDLGHHIHTLLFAGDKTTLKIKKNVEIIEVEEQFLPLNQWVDVTIELKKGTILLKIDDKKHIFKSPEIDMTGHSQIDFKGVDFGSCQIDHIKVWEGL
ncbi:MAG: hypothetical protein P1V20_11520 [Verrucomicrobiales bacterium]|nr:hypothetical protein [Verrucomicrobiales bacterium]